MDEVNTIKHLTSQPSKKIEESENNVYNTLQASKIIEESENNNNNLWKQKVLWEAELLVEKMKQNIYAQQLQLCRGMEYKMMESKIEDHQRWITRENYQRSLQNRWHREETELREVEAVQLVSDCMKDVTKYYF